MKSIARVSTGFLYHLGFFKNGHASSFGFDDLVAGGNLIESLWTNVACEVVDLLCATILKSYFFTVEIISVTFTVCV